MGDSDFNLESKKQKSAKSQVPKTFEELSTSGFAFPHAPLVDITKDLTELLVKMSTQKQSPMRTSDDNRGVHIFTQILELEPVAAGIAYLLGEVPITISEINEVKKAMLNPAYTKFANERFSECLVLQNETEIDFIRQFTSIGMQDPITRTGLANSYAFVCIWNRHNDPEFLGEPHLIFKHLCDGSLERNELKLRYPPTSANQAVLRLYQEMQLLFYDACLLKSYLDKSSREIS
jgi:hypothetical protein